MVFGSPVSYMDHPLLRLNPWIRNTSFIYLASVFACLRFSTCGCIFACVHASVSLRASMNMAPGWGSRGTPHLGFQIEVQKTPRLSLELSPKRHPYKISLKSAQKFLLGTTWLWKMAAHTTSKPVFYNNGYNDDNHPAWIKVLYGKFSIADKNS